jgi:hypothetical protein
MKEYQDGEDHIARNAINAALSEINKGRQSMARCTPSFTEAVQQEKSRAEEAWVC